MAAVRRRERDVVEENGVTTTTPPTVKRRKMEEEVDVVESRIILSPCVQATNRGGIVARNSAGASETSVVIVRRRDSPVEEQCQIEEELDRVSSVSCCSSNNRSEEKSKRRIDFVDVEVNEALLSENNGDDQSGTSWIYDNFNKRSDSYSEESSVNMEIQALEDVESRRRLKMQKKKKSLETTVKEDELEDFFQAAEKNLRNKMLECSTKYNFDFEKDEPLGGRYESVKLNP